MSQKLFIKSISTILLGLSLAACGGGGASGGGTTPTVTSLSGTAAVGFAVVNGTVNIKCANSTAIAPSTTSAAGAIQVNLTGQTLPCALQVTGGTINGVANTNNYHSVATSAGNVNVTPLTDLLVANLTGTATPTTWFAGLTTAQLAAITAGQVTTAATNVKTALGLTTQLAGIDLITTAFTPTRNNVMDNTLEALQAAITNNATPYATLLTNAGASANAGFTTPAGFNAALTAAYIPPGGGTTPTVTGFSPNTGAVGTVVTITGTNLGLGFQPAPIVKFGTTAVTTPLTFNGQTSISFAVPTGLAAGAHTVTIGGMTGVPLTVGTFTVTAAPVAPAAPGGATATAISATQIDLAWSTVATATSYNVYRSTAANVGITAGNKINASPVTTLTYSDSVGLTASTPYFYKMTAVNVGGESVGSAEVTATTSAAGAAGVPVLLAGDPYNLVGNFDNTGALARFGRAVGIVTDTLGNAYVADGINKSIRKITPAGVVTTFAGPDYAACGGAAFLGTSCPTGDTDGAGTTALFRNPSSIAIDTAGNLYVGDQNRIRKITPASVVSTLAGPDAASWIAFPTGNGLSGFVDGTGTAARFNGTTGITGLATDSLGNVYAADGSNHTIRKITPAGVVTTLAGPDNATCAAAAFASCPTGYVNGTGAVARFSSPSGIATDAADNIYVVDGARIRKITPAGAVTTFAGIDVGGPFLGSYVDATGTAARFSLLIDITSDASGNLYVADGYGGTGNNLIRKITPAGVVTTVLGVLNSTNSILTPNIPTIAYYKISVNASSLYISQENRIAVVNPKP